MATHQRTKRKRMICLLLSMLLLGPLVLVACAQAPQGPTSPTTGTMGTGAMGATVVLKHAPSGSATLTWNPSTHVLQVKIVLVGLAPGSTHPAHIHQGSCGTAGNIVYMLQNVTADSKGDATSVSTINGVMNGIPATGWYVNVHNGPNLAPADQFLPIACGNVANHQSSLPGSQSAVATLSSTTADNQDASGTAQFTISNGTLLVDLTIHGLVPNSTHAAHVHLGSCAAQGPVAYMFNPLVANQWGIGQEKMSIPGITSIPRTGWYINVHLSTTLTTQTGFDPISCGDILPG